MRQMYIQRLEFHYIQPEEDVDTGQNDLLFQKGKPAYPGLRTCLSVQI